MQKQREYRITVDGTEVLYYVSSHARTWRPAKTLLVFAPDRTASDIGELRLFAENSGWKRMAEEDGGVLVLPVAACGWKNESVDKLKKIYRAVWNNSPSADPEDFRGTVWCWETLIFCTGYDEGAVFAGNAAVAHPNMFACACMVNGQPDDYSAGEKFSDRWMLPDAAPSWQHRNMEIPVEILMLCSDEPEEARRYFLSTACSEEQVTVLTGYYTTDEDTTALIMEEFSTRIRWKNSPDGTAARCLSKKQFYTSGEFERDSVEHNGFSYDFFCKVPEGVTDTEGMPVVLLLHGHGEPAWLFSYKNGWAELCDETGAYLLVLPDSPENSWKVGRDEGVIPKIIDRLAERYGADRERIYLTGFSNGSLATTWYGERQPELFAAISPWNSPMICYEDELEQSGYELPVFAVNGDLDHKMDVPRQFYREQFSAFQRINGGTPEESEDGPVRLRPDEIRDASDRYTAEAGYTEGGRLTTYVFSGRDGIPRVCFTNVSDMPHGAIYDTSRAAWDFLRHFRRPGNGKRSEYTD
ncbi:MAG: hypothetical protein J5744_06910 [Oscillospiraceae bacterium]|nr:hypothetical protein [Oscillospiraceae bacterium]